MTAPDVVVVGGGPVGLAAAIALRLRGVKVLVADRARPPIDKPCGEGLMPDGVAALNRLGIASDFDGALPFRGIRFKEMDAVAEGWFSSGYGLGIPAHRVASANDRSGRGNWRRHALGRCGARRRSRRSGNRRSQDFQPLGDRRGRPRVIGEALGGLATPNGHAAQDRTAATFSDRAVDGPRGSAVA